MDTEFIGADYHFFVYKKSLESSTINNLINLTDFFLKDSLTPKLDFQSKLAGRITNGKQIIIPPKMVPQEIINQICESIDHYVNILSQQRFKSLNHKLQTLWIVSQKEHDYNPMHIHSGTISGIIYLKVPKSIQRNEYEESDGKLVFTYGMNIPKQLNFQGNKIITPKAGDLYLFPSWLHHGVYPFKGEEERRSISFNFDIDIELVEP